MKNLNMRDDMKKFFIIPQKEINNTISFIIKNFNALPKDIVIIRLSSIERIHLPFQVPEENILDLCLRLDDVDPISHGIDFIFDAGKCELPPFKWLNKNIIKEIKSFILSHKERPFWIFHCDEGQNRSPALAFCAAFLLGEKELCLEIFSNYSEINKTLVFSILKEEIFSLLISF